MFPLQLACLFSAINLFTNFLFPLSFYATYATVIQILYSSPFPHSETSFTTIHFGPSPMSAFVTRTHSLAWMPRTFHLLHAKFFQSTSEACQLCERPPRIAHSKHFRVGEPVHFSTIFLTLQKQLPILCMRKLFVGQGVCQAAAHNYNYYTL